MEVILTKQGYAEARDEFARVSSAIESLQCWAFDSDWFETGETRTEHAYALDRNGFYMTGDDYLAVEEARQLFARLAGLNAARAL